MNENKNTSSYPQDDCAQDNCPLPTCPPLLVVQNRVKERMRMLGLMHIQNPRNLLVDVLRSINRATQFQDGFPRHECLFVIVLDFYVDHVDSPIQFPVPSQEVCR